MIQYTPLHIHTDFSLMDGLSKPTHLAARCKEIGVDTCAMTDHGTISGAVQFSQAMHKADIKPILGCELYVNSDYSDKDNNLIRHTTHLVILSKNKEGWRQLIQILSAANRPENFYRKPRISISQLQSFDTTNIIAICGHPGSTLSEAIIETNVLMTAKSSIRQSLNINNGLKIAKQLQRTFDNFYIEIQCVDAPHCPQILVFNDALRYIARELSLPCVATPDAHYCRHENAEDQRILLSNQLKRTLPEIRKSLQNGENVPLQQFFVSENYHVPTADELLEYGNTKEELQTTMNIANQCEDYDITTKPILPLYKLPDGVTSGEHLRELCKKGWKDKLHLLKASMKRIGVHSDVYGKRFEHEYKVLTDANLADYFLIVKDIIEYAKSQSMVMAPGRGSAAGSLILYLLDVTQVDPIEYGLIFERFYNKGRNTADHVSLPDVDMDFEIRYRGKIIEYIKNRFGDDKVAQMITFGRMQGRSALRDVLRANEDCSAEVMDEITKHIPNESEISDQLQAMKELDKESGGMGEASIIDWALDHHADKLSQWCEKDENGNLHGQLARSFAQAIRIEGTKRSQGKHAAGVIIANEPLHEICPMVKGKGGEEILCGLEMNDLEAIGCVKFDILGTAVLDKIHMALDLINAVP